MNPTLEEQQRLLEVLPPLLGAGRPAVLVVGPASPALLDGLRARGHEVSAVDARAEVEGD
jgi:hypothetical protein